MDEDVTLGLISKLQICSIDTIQYRHADEPHDAETRKLFTVFCWNLRLESVTKIQYSITLKVEIHIVNFLSTKSPKQKGYLIGAFILVIRTSSAIGCNS